MPVNTINFPGFYPSPNLPTLESAVVYPGTVLIEGTNLSEGRGTTRPFELIGAPDINPNTLVMDLNALGLPGVHFRPTAFEPTFQKHAPRTCGGCQIHVTDRRTLQASGNRCCHHPSLSQTFRFTIRVADTAV
ncbi:MAG: hypothetical protein Ct9H300mP25_16630 [Acidobacteriota bacterium]|nr:MAG: hypothetical protein Ct9H300mP25_16630 [Acidobacteriota bacterium]